MEAIAIKKRAREIVADKRVKDYSQDPAVIKKVKSAKRLISKYDLGKKIK
jgi:hypothetical protein